MNERGRAISLSALSLLLLYLLGLAAVGICIKRKQSWLLIVVGSRA